MKMWCTTIRAVCPIRNELTTWSGPNVPGISEDDGNDYCQTHGLGYCKVEGELVSEIPCKEGTLEPDFKNEVDYQKQQLN